MKRAGIFGFLSIPIGTIGVWNHWNGLYAIRYLLFNTCRRTHDATSPRRANQTSLWPVA